MESIYDGESNFMTLSRRAIAMVEREIGLGMIMSGEGMRLHYSGGVPARERLFTKTIADRGSRGMADCDDSTSWLNIRA